MAATTPTATAKYQVPSAEVLIEAFRVSSVPEKFARCAKCGAKAKSKPEGLKVCSRCKHVAFCDVKCQKAFWKTHKASCGICERVLFMSHALPVAVAIDEDAGNPPLLNWTHRGVSTLLSLVDDQPEGVGKVDIDKAARIEFSLLPGNIEPELMEGHPGDEVMEEPGEDGEEDGGIGRLQKMLGKMKIHANVTLGSAEERSQDLEGAKEIVIPTRNIQLRYTYPLTTEATFRYEAPTEAGWSREELVLQIAKTYEVMMGLDAAKEGAFGVKLYKNLDDLQLHSLYQIIPDTWEVVVTA